MSADTVPITGGSGVNVAVDDIGTFGGDANARAQYMKIMDGTLSSQTVAEVEATRNALQTVARENRALLSASSSALNTAAYAQYDAVGGIFSFSNAALETGLGGIIESILVTDVDANMSLTTALRLWLFNSTPSGGTYTDASALSLSDTDATSNLVGHVDLGTFGTPIHGSNFTFVYAKGVALPYRCDATTLFGVLQLTALDVGFGTFAAASDIKIQLSVIRD